MVKSPKNILLVYPEFPKTTYWSFSGARRFDGRKAVMPPLALLTVGAMLPKDYDLRLVDMNVKELTDADLEWADSVFTSSMIVQRDSLEEVTTRAHEHGKSVVAGGQLPTLAYEQIPWVDHFVLNEAEATLGPFLKDLEAGNPKRVYAQEIRDFRGKETPYQEAEIERLIRFFEGSSQDIRIAATRPAARTTPLPRFDLLEDTLYDYVSMAVQVSRGCPFSCGFCEIPRLYGHGARVKGGNQILEEFDVLRDMGWKGSVFVVDDNFIANQKEIKALLPQIAAWQEAHGFPFQLFTEASMNIDDTILGLMQKAGFNRVFTGIETFNPEVLRNTSKRQNAVRDMHATIRNIQRHGIEPYGGFIVGLDGSTEEDYDLMRQSIRELGIVNAMVGLLTVSPGSPDYYTCKKEGRLVQESGGDNTHSFTLNFVPKDGQDPEEIIRQYMRVLSAVYDPTLKNYFERVRALYDTLGETGVHFAANPSWKSLMAGVKSLLYQPFQPYGWEYSKFIAWTLRHHPSKFVDAITDAIKGHHFWAITQGSLELHELTTFMGDHIEYLNGNVPKLTESIPENGEYPTLLERLQGYQHEAQAALSHAKQRIMSLSPPYREAAQRHYASFVEHIEHIVESINGIVHPSQKSKSDGS